MYVNVFKDCLLQLLRNCFSFTLSCFQIFKKKIKKKKNLKGALIKSEGFFGFVFWVNFSPKFMIQGSPKYPSSIPHWDPQMLTEF